MARSKTIAELQAEVAAATKPKASRGSVSRTEGWVACDASVDFPTSDMHGPMHPDTDGGYAAAEADRRRQPKRWPAIRWLSEDGYLYIDRPEGS